MVSEVMGKSQDIRQWLCLPHWPKGGSRKQASHSKGPPVTPRLTVFPLHHAYPVSVALENIG